MASDPQPRVGIHVSIAGKLSEAVDRAEGMGCEAMQIFESSPRTWNSTPFDPVEVELFKAKRRAAGIDPVVVHASYLINISTFKPELRAKSRPRRPTGCDAAPSWKRTST